VKPRLCGPRLPAALILAVALGGAAFACDGSSDGEAANPLALYPVGPDTAFMDALIGGVLEVDGPCVYVVSPRPPAERTLVAFPADRTAWDSEAEAIFLGGKRLEPGRAVTISGGFTPSRQFEGWPAPPHEDCDASHLWLAADAGPVIP
jgi:hypothetical protein